MTIRVELAPAVLEDFERILEHLKYYDVAAPDTRLEEIITAVSILETSPLIGRPISNDKRELVIGQDSKGYIVQYHYHAEVKIVLVLAIRSQREVGF